MFNGLTNFFQKLNNHFTYRQRFVFFSFVFILTTPIPGYWLINVENFFIDRAEWQLQGSHLQGITGDLYHDVIRYRFAAMEGSQDHWKETNEDLLEKAIEQRFSYLKNSIKAITFDPRPTLGNGYTAPAFKPINPEPAYLAWLNLIEKHDAGIDQAAFTLLIDELEKLQLQIGDTFEVLLAPTQLQNQLLSTIYVQLPEAEKLISDLFVYHEMMSEKRNDLNQLVMINELKKNLSETRLILNDTYSTHAEELKNLGSTYSSARHTLSDYISSTEKFLQDLINDTGQFRFESVPRALDANDNLRKLNESMTRSIFESQLSWYRIALRASLTVYLTVALTLSFYLIFRVLTRHLMEICYHLREMTRGNFRTCFTSHFNDEFGLIGRTFDKMSLSVQDVLRELKKLGNQLTDSITQITRAAKIQEDNAAAQERKVKEIEATAKLIAHDSRELANRMNELNKKSSESSVADTAKEGLDRMQDKMVNLATASNDIISSLSSLDEKVVSAHTLIAFMTKVSDQARLLSLNSAIETASIPTNRASFLDITKKIQRFAEKTNDSTEEIRLIINEISDSVVNVRQEAHGCLNEINEGAHRLINLSNQLTMITRQGKEQIKKFENVNGVMEMQAIAAEKIIKSISHLGETAEESTRSIRTLHQSIEQLGQTAEELQKSIGLFV